MYWTDWGDAAKIERAGMDGSARRVLFDTTNAEIAWPNGLTIDYYSETLYWVDARYHTVASCDYDGERYSVIVRDHSIVQHPFQVAVFENNLYWTDWDAYSVRSVNKFSGELVEDVVSRLQSATPYGIAIWQNSTQPLGMCHWYKTFISSTYSRNLTGLSVR